MEIRNFYKCLFLLAIVFCIVFTNLYLIPFESLGKGPRIPQPQSHSSPFLTINNNGGQLGNQMFLFATLIGLCALNGRQVNIQQGNYDALSKYFDITMPIVDKNSFNETNPWKIGNWLSEKDHSIPLTSNIIKGNTYPTSYTFFDHVRGNIREIFHFKASYRSHAQDILWKIKQIRPHTKVYVGIHVRRGDYLKHSNGGWLRAYDGREVDIEFFEKALQYFKFKYQNITFLVVSDDRKWCRKNLSHLGILTTPDSPSAGHDLALLAECNHTIMTYGTYGFWGGYLSGGEVVYFTDFLKPNSNFLKYYFVYDKIYPADWIGISTTKPGFWESYTNPYLQENNNNITQNNDKR